MASQKVDFMTSSLIDTLNKDIYTVAHGGRPLDIKHIGEGPTLSSMYGVPENPFVVGDDDEYVEETVVSPLSESNQRTSAWHPDTWTPDRFSKGSEYDRQHGSPYAEEVHDPQDSVHFNRVNWDTQQQQGHTQSREVDDGLGIHMVEGDRAIDEKHSWEPTQPPPSAYRPNTACDFEDVELNKPNEKPGSKLSKRNRACTENNFRILLWALVLLLPFVVLPLAIFGGVYHWGKADGLCKAGGGTWHADTHDCQY